MDPYASGGAKGVNQEMSWTKGAQHKNTSGRGSSWYAAQSGYQRGCSSRLQDGMSGGSLLENWDFDVGRGMEVVNAPEKNKKKQRKSDKHLFKLGHLVENTFLYLKRGIYYVDFFSIWFVR